MMFCFIGDIYEFQEYYEDVTAKAIVLRKLWFKGAFAKVFPPLIISWNCSTYIFWYFVESL